MKYLKVIIGIIIFFFLLISCEKEEILNSDTSSGFISEGIWAGEYWPTDEWRFCNPEEVGMNSKKLNELDDEIQLLLKLHFDVHSVLIVKDGYIVAEKYYTGDFNADSLHPVYSCTKSVTSYLIGISIEMGNIPGMNTRMVDFFPEYEIQNLSPQKEQITLEHLLTMSAGLEWYELEYKYSDERNTFRQWNNSDDKVKFVLDQHMVAIPGEEYSYNTGISHVLSAIIQKSTGIRTDSFAIKQLFNPLGINDYYWPVDSKGVAFGGARLWLKPRDMAKFGYLFLKNGIWMVSNWFLKIGL